MPLAAAPSAEKWRLIHRPHPLKHIAWTPKSVPGSAAFADRFLCHEGFPKLVQVGLQRRAESEVPDVWRCKRFVDPTRAFRQHSVPLRCQPSLMSPLWVEAGLRRRCDERHKQSFKALVELWGRMRICAALLISLCLTGCDRKPSKVVSITVKLPPARPYIAEPGFSLDGPQRLPSV